MGAESTLKLAFILSATDKMSRIVDEAVKKSTDKLSAFERTTGKVGRSMMKAGAWMTGAGAAVGGAMFAASKSVADYAGKIKDTSEATGIGVEAWQKMTYAAKISGIEQEKLSTSMVKFDKLIAEAAGGSKTAGQVFKDLGIKIKDAGGKMREPNEIFNDVVEVFGKTKDGAMKTALACEIFGKSGADLMPMLNEGKEGLAGLYEAAERSGNILSEDAITACDEFGKKMDAVGQQVKGLGLQVGATLVPTIHNLVNNVSEIIQKVADWMKKNPQLAETIGKVGMALAGFLALAGTLSVIFGGITFAVGQFGKAFRNISKAIRAGTALVKAAKNSMFMFRIQYAALVVWGKLAAAAQWLFNTSLLGCPIIWIVAAIMAIIAVVVLLVKHWDKVSTFFKQLWDKVVTIFSSAWEGIKAIWGTVADWFAGLWDKVKNGISAAWEWIKSLFLNYTPHGLIIKHWDSISAWFSGLWDKVKNGISAAWEWIKNLFLNYTPHGLIIKHWDSISAWFAGLWDKVKNGIAGAWDGIKSWFSNLNPLEWITSAWDRVAEFFVNLRTRFFEWGQNLFSSLWNGIQSVVNKVVEGVKNVGKKIANGFKSIFGINSPSKLFAEYGLNITQGLVVGMGNGGGAVERATESMAANATAGMTANIPESRAIPATRNITQNLQNATNNASQTVNSGGVNLTYSPQITFSGSVSPETKEDFRKMLKQHANEILSIVQRNEENKARLSFNT